MSHTLPLALLTVFSISALLAAQAQTPDLVRLGNLKFALYGAVSYMKEGCAIYDLKVEERIFPKGPVAATSRKALNTCKRRKERSTTSCPGTPSSPSSSVSKIKPLPLPRVNQPRCYPGSLRDPAPNESSPHQAGCLSRWRPELGLAPPQG